MIAWDVWQVPLGLLALGALFLSAAWLLLVEYRRAFVSDPFSVMSIEVLANIVKLGGPGYLAMLALITGLPMFLGGALILVALVGFWVYEQASVLLRAISQTLGFS